MAKKRTKETAMVPKLPGKVVVQAYTLGASPTTGSFEFTKNENELDVRRGRYANSFAIWVARDEIALDFFADLTTKTSSERVHVGRFFIAPQRAQGLVDALKKQIAAHKKMTATSPKQG